MIRSIRSQLLCVILLGVSLVCGGCTGLGWLAYVFIPPPKVEPLFEIPQGKTLLVFVDAGPTDSEYQSIVAELTKRLNTQLEANEIVEKTIPYSKLVNLSASDPDFGDLYINQVGLKVGADIVLYVLVEKFQLRGQQMAPLWEGLFETSIRVVDVTEGRLWPTDRRGGYPLAKVRTPMESEMSPAHRVKLARRLADKMADKIAKCFYKHEDTEDDAPSWAYE